MPLIEAIRVAATQRGDAKPRDLRRSLVEQPAQDRAAQPEALELRRQVEVLDTQRLGFALGAERDTARRVVSDHDAPRVGRPERASKPLRRARRVEATEALQAFAHHGDAQRQQGVEIGLGDRGELECGGHGVTV